MAAGDAFTFTDDVGDAYVATAGKHLISLDAGENVISFQREDLASIVNLLESASKGQWVVEPEVFHCGVQTRAARWHVDPEPAEHCETEVDAEGERCARHEAPDEPDWDAMRKDAQFD